jgi:hypothetical protein
MHTEVWNQGMSGRAELCPHIFNEALFALVSTLRFHIQQVNSDVNQQCFQPKSDQCIVSVHCQEEHIVHNSGKLQKSRFTNFIFKTFKLLIWFLKSAMNRIQIELV